MGRLGGGPRGKRVVVTTGDVELAVKKLDFELVGPARERLQGLRDFVVNNLGPEPTVDDIPEAEPEADELEDENEGEILVADL